MEQEKKQVAHVALRLDKELYVGVRRVLLDYNLSTGEKVSIRALLEQKAEEFFKQIIEKGHP